MAVEHDITDAAQLAEWVKGNSLHRKVDSKCVKGGECTPDFSCCVPELLATKDERLAYAAAGRGERNKFLVMFLHRALGRRAAKTGRKPRVLIITDTDHSLLHKKDN